MMMPSEHFLETHGAVIDIIIIGIIGFAIEIAMRLLENWLIPWKGKG